MSKTLTLTLKDVPTGVEVVCSTWPPTLIERAAKQDETLTSAELYMVRLLAVLQKAAKTDVTEH